MTISTAIDSSAVARAVGIKTQYQDLRNNSVVNLPQRIAVIGQGSTASTYSNAKSQVFSAFEVGQDYGFGSPLHLAVKELLPANGDGVGTMPVTVYPLDDAGGAVAATGTITPTGTATESGSFKIRLGGEISQNIAVAIGDTVADLTAAITAAINGQTDIPAIATDNATSVGLAAKWAGESGNSIDITVVGIVPAGLAIGLTAFASGASNPDVTTALALIGTQWETLIVNCLNAGDTVALAAYSSENEGRWGPLSKNPLMAFTGDVETSATTAIVVSDSRPSDRTNIIVNVPGSINLPWVIAASAVSRVAVLAQNNPPHDYGRQKLSNIIPGLDSEQFNYAELDSIVKGGTATTVLRDNVVVLSDVVTFYHPSGDPTPAYRYAVDIVKLQNLIYNIDLIFDSPEWDGAPLLPDNQSTTNPTAKTPKMAVSEVAGLVDSMAEAAILSDPVAIKKSIIAAIDSANPKRLNLALTAKLGGNANQISVDLNFGFLFG